MRKAIYLMNVSLDGYIEGPSGDLSWTEPDEELHQHFNDLEQTIDMHPYGRRLYEIMSAAWPTADQDRSASEVVKEYARSSLSRGRQPGACYNLRPCGSKC